MSPRPGLLASSLRTLYGTSFNGNRGAPKDAQARIGFTLMELLVVIAIVAR